MLNVPVPWVLRETTLVGISGVTVVVSLAILLFGFGSAVAAVTVAVFVSVADALGAVTTISTVAVTPLGKMPRLHAIVLVPEQVPELGVAETNETPAGRKSVRVTLLVVAGMVGMPLFVTVRW